MRSGRRLGCALLVGLSLGAASLVLTPSPVSAAECPEGMASCIALTFETTVDGATTREGPVFVATTDLAGIADITDRQYLKRRNVDGEVSNGPRVAQGVSIRRLLEQYDPDPDAGVTFSETPDASGVPSVLSRDDYVDPDSVDDEDRPFVDDLQPVVYLIPSGRNAGRIGYVRPLRDLEKDVNSSDILAVPNRLDLTFHRTGRLLEPVVKASAGSAVETKEKNTFSVSFAKSPRTRIVSTRWSFGDNTTRGTKRDEPTHAYTRQGTYGVVAQVRGADGSYGRSAPLEIAVDDPPDAPSSGAGGSASGGGTGGGGFGGGGYVPPYDPGAGDFPMPDLPSEDFPQDLPQDLPLDDGLEEVEGFVLAGSEIVAGGVPEQIPGTQDSSTAAPVGQASTRTTIATWAVFVLASAALIGLGATSETRWFRTRLRHLRRRA